MDLDALLAGCLSNENSIRSSAEQTLKALSGKVELVPELLKRVEHAPDPQLRQLAAVLLRKRVARLWPLLPLEARQTTQAFLLQRIAHEPLHVVRRAIADLAAAVAKQAMPRSEWPELLGILHQWSQGTSLDYRELAFLMFSSLAEIIGEHLQPALPTLIGIISAGLRDADRVRASALKAVEPLMFLVNSEADIVQFHGLVANMVECAREALVGGSEDVAVYVCQLLVDMVEVPAPLTQPHLPGIVAFCMEVAVAKQLELGTREQALQVVAWVARYKPKQLSKQKALVRQIVDALCSMACEPAESEQEARESGALSARAMAGQALDALALHVSSALICPQVLTFAKQAAASPDPQHRCGAMTVLAVMCEGCAELLRKRLEEDILPLVLAGLRDPDQNVRGAAAFAIGQMSEFMAYDVVSHYAAVLPAVFAIMADPDPIVQERACYALDTFCENMDRENILPFMPQLIERLVGVLSHGATTNNHDVQEMALSAIASTAAAAAADFAPYVGAVLPALQHFLTVERSELLPCRCRATECMGLLLEHLGATQQVAIELIPQVMALGIQGFHLNNTELREYTHGLFAAIAKALKAGFTGYLQHVVPLAIESLEQDDGAGSEDDDAEDGAGPSANGPGQGAENSDEEGSSEGGHDRQFSVRTGVLDEKCAALNALGLYAEHLPVQFAPYLVQVLQLAAAGANYFHEEIRAQACTAFAKLVIATHHVFPPVPPLPQSQEVTQALSEVGPALLGALEDCDKGVVSAALGALKDLLSALGAQPMLPWLEKASQGITDVLQHKAVCFEYEDDKDDGEDTEDEGGDAVEDLVAAAGDLAAALIGATGADAYAPVLASQHLPALMTRLRPQQPDGIRGVAMGVLAEISERMQAHMVPHLPKVVPSVLKELRAEDAVNRQNAAFAAGVLVEGCGLEAMGPFLPQLLQSLHPLFGPKEAAGTRDNAVGCVGRMLLASPGAPLVPLDAVLPNYLRALPPKEDWEESHVAYQALCHLLAQGAQGVAGVAIHVPAIVQALGTAIVHPKLPQTTRTLIVNTIAQLRQHFAAQADPLLATLPGDQQQALLGVV